MNFKHYNQGKPKVFFVGRENQFKTKYNKVYTPIIGLLNEKSITICNVKESEQNHLSSFKKIKREYKSKGD
jgi:hypothetical protein